MTRAGEQNHLDLACIVDEVNEVFADSVSFVFLPGDVADDGSRAVYAIVRGELDRLRAPWCAILGDHDVRERRFSNFLEAMGEHTRYAFTVGPVRFIAMNAFDIADPGSFVVGKEQLAWVERALRAATDAAQTKVLLLHCDPSDLKAGRTELAELIRGFEVRLIDMGHTHYNEIADDGRTLYSATRSIGQIEEGPVGYSVINLDGDTVSWRFVELGKLPVAVITSPGDERLSTNLSQNLPLSLNVRAKVWSQAKVSQVKAQIPQRTVTMQRVPGSQVWEATVDTSFLGQGVHALQVAAADERGFAATDEVRLVIGDLAEKQRAERDQDNALEAWPEHGLLGTQLGPNKNGKKW
jgi:3',5'-cyclic-AMP phosphodiesterase